ncbi:MAG: hypothetical protein A3F43_02600 [Gammaproteobacteria bacterium RIFCSPHIGHO2_12_FULL_42_10]|nr:MAG: hypothetical protein A3F43_02600 [Gammaproteobacteria bacterium RIFCSPHIGHO2_12_FULL_42_10]
MPHTTPYHALFNALDQQTTILTPNRRLSATLHKQYLAHQQAQDKTMWETPDILPVKTWIERLWNTFSHSMQETPRYLLNTKQTQQIWEKIIAKTTLHHALVQLSGIATLAASAWGLLKQWQIDPTAETSLVLYEEITHDYVLFHRWCIKFHKICQKNRWIDPASLPDALNCLIKKNSHYSLHHPAACPQDPESSLEQPRSRGQAAGRQSGHAHHKIILVGFTEISPQLHSLLAHYQNHTIYSLPDRAKTHCISLKDEQTEILTMARWAKTCLEQKRSHIGCVIPTLDKKRDHVAQIFKDLLGEENVNISAGKSSRQCPLIGTALQLLSLHTHTISIDDFGGLLQSPFLGDAENEQIKRAKINRILHRKNIHTLHLPSEQLEVTPKLNQRLRTFFTILNHTKHTNTYHVWTVVFTQLLTALGWPGERSLNSEEYQTIEHWEKGLHSFALLDHVNPPCTIESALHALQQIATNSIFQPKTPDAPVQVLGLLEAASMPFDALWIMGMDDRTLPPKPKPHPFIPKPLQRKQHMPHATALREYDYCRTLIQQFKSTVDHLIFSYPEKENDLILQMSPLLEDIATTSIDELNIQPAPLPAYQVFQSSVLEHVEEACVPVTTNNAPVRGGVFVLKDQALCPFKAFATWRLFADVTDTTEPGLRAKDRGSLLHKTLELIWDKLQNHATLKTHDESTLKQLITTCIDEAYQLSQTIIAPFSKRPMYLSLEKQRLTVLLWEWLQLEKTRPAFTVFSKEASSEIAFNQLKLKIRIDRIDLIDGKKLIIDYKASKMCHINDWFDERPPAPQLPLYALLDAEKTIGITFAQVAVGQYAFKGISAHDLNIKGIEARPSWSNELQQWQSTLTKLSDDFCHGVAIVDPKDPINTCQWCHLKPLCRIQQH